MSKKSSGNYPTFVASIIALVLAFSALQASHTQDPDIDFAQLIIVEIEALQDAAVASIPKKQAEKINNRLRVAIFMLEKVINSLQKNTNTSVVVRLGKML